MKKLKLKWRHKQIIGKAKIYSKDIIEMLKLGATFELNPAYTIYYKDGGKRKIELLHISLNLKKNDNRNSRK